MAFASSAKAPRATVRELVVHFVSIGFTLKVWQRWLRRRVQAFGNGMPVRFEPGQKRVIWIFGSGRSGTTWAMELIQRGYNLHSVFEPFHSGNPELPESVAQIGPLITQDLDELGLNADDIRRVTEGRLKNSWVDRSNPGLPLGKRNGVVIKDVATRMFQSHTLLSTTPDAEPVLMLRQPISMLKSLLAANEIWQKDELVEASRLAELVTMNSHRFTDKSSEMVLALVARVDESTLGRETVPVIRWCLENLVSLQLLSGNPKFKVLSYERLKRDDPKELPYLVSNFGPLLKNPKAKKRSRTDLGLKPAAISGEVLHQTAEVFTHFGLTAFQIPDKPHLLDLEKLAADYQKPAEARLAPNLLRP